jgi:acyl carrier protein
MDVRATLTDLLRELGFDPAGLQDGTRLRQDLKVDSTELVEISVAIERRLRVAIDAGAFQAVDTVGELFRFVETAPAR